MSESIIQLLEKALDGADKDREYLLEQLETIQTIGDILREIIYYDCTDQDYQNGHIPLEFSCSAYFMTCWDAIDKALGNTVLMVMPPSIFEPTKIEQKSTEKQSSTQPIIINPTPQNNGNKRQPSSGFFSGLMDYQIAKLEHKSNQQKTQKPTIITERVTYDPKEVVHQLIPSLNELKQIYFRFLHRHQSNKKPSIYLLKHGHALLQEKMSKYFNVISPFCIASITFQVEKIRKDKLLQTAHMSRIAQAEAEARAFTTPFIPPEIRALSRAFQEGANFFPDGIKIPSDDELVKRVRNRRGKT
jgi:hypothetical protein